MKSGLRAPDFNPNHPKNPGICTPDSVWSTKVLDSTWDLGSGIRVYSTAQQQHKHKISITFINAFDYHQTIHRYYPIMNVTNDLTLLATTASDEQGTEHNKKGARRKGCKHMNTCLSASIADLVTTTITSEMVNLSRKNGEQHGAVEHGAIYLHPSSS